MNPIDLQRVKVSNCTNKDVIFGRGVGLKLCSLFHRRRAMLVRYCYERAFYRRRDVQFPSNAMTWLFVCLSLLLFRISPAGSHGRYVSVNLTGCCVRVWPLSVL